LPAVALRPGGAGAAVIVTAALGVSTGPGWADAAPPVPVVAGASRLSTRV